MSTKDLWKPGMRSIKTPLGIETAVPESMSEEAVKDFLAEVDLGFATDPDNQKQQERTLRRAERWDRQQAPLRAWAEHYRSLPEDDSKPIVGTDAYQEQYKQFLAEFAQKGSKHAASEGKRLSRNKSLRNVMTEEDVVAAHGPDRVKAVKERKAKS